MEITFKLFFKFNTSTDIVYSDGPVKNDVKTLNHSQKENNHKETPK